MGALRDMLQMVEEQGTLAVDLLEKSSLENELIPKAIGMPGAMIAAFDEVHPGKYEVLTGDDSSVAAGMAILSSSATWQMKGRQVLEVTPDLAASLALTDAPQGISRSLPHDAFIISLPNSPFSAAWKPGTPRVPVLGFLVSLQSHFHTEGELDAEKSKETWERVGCFPITRGTLVDLTSDNKEETDLHGTWDLNTPFNDHNNLGVTDEDMSILSLAFRLIANLSIYVQEKVEKKPATKTKRFHSVSEKVGITTYGSNVKLPAPIMEYVRAGNGSPAFRIHSRFTVRGHWRNQSYGRKRLLRKRLWIKPHWKGPTEGEQLKRIYQVTER